MRQRGGNTYRRSNEAVEIRDRVISTGVINDR
jgi:hypothetical protein